MSLLGFLFPTTGIISAIINFFSNVVPKLFDLLLPVWTALIQFLKWYLSQFWIGLAAIFHNLAIVTVIIPLILFTFGWTTVKEEKECAQELVTIREQYRFVPRKNPKMIQLETKRQKWNSSKGVWETISETVDKYK